MPVYQKYDDGKVVETVHTKDGSHRDTELGVLALNGEKGWQLLPDPVQEPVEEQPPPATPAAAPKPVPAPAPPRTKKKEGERDGGDD